jgi:hypothetical protein
MVARPMGLGSAADEDAQRRRGFGREDRDDGEQGEEAAQGERLGAKVQKCKGANVGVGVGVDMDH